MNLLKQTERIIMKQYQVEVYKDGVFYSILANSRGKTKLCHATAKKWSKEYTKTFLANPDCLQTLLKISIV